MPIQHENILKVLDIHYSLFSREFMGFINGKLPTYQDLIMSEDLFSPGDLQNSYPEMPDKVDQELTEVAALMKAQECGYFRIIYT